MKKALFSTLSVLFFLSLFHLACKKTEIQKSEQVDAQSLTIIEAKNWFLKNNSSASSQKSRVAGQEYGKLSNFSPIWESAIVEEDNRYIIVETAVTFNKTPGFINNAITPDATISSINGSSKLVLLKDKISGLLQAAFMHVIDSSGKTNKAITYSNRSSDFTGEIFFTDLSGKFINGWLYKAGKIVKKSNQIAAPVKNALVNPDDEDCETIETRWYEQWCDHYTNGDVECSPWEYIGSTFRTYCESGGGGGGGGGGYGGDEADMDDINNYLVTPCLSDTWEALMSNDVNVDLVYLLKSTFSATTRFNLSISEASDFEVDADGNSIDATTITTRQPNGTFDMHVYLNKVELQDASKEYIAATMFHEIIHAYMRATGVLDEKLHHEQMGQYYISSMMYSIQKVFPSLSDSQARSLALGGLKKTTNFSRLSQSEKDEILAENQRHKLSIHGTSCN